MCHISKWTINSTVASGSRRSVQHSPYLYSVQDRQYQLGYNYLDNLSIANVLASGFFWLRFPPTAERRAFNSYKDLKVVATSVEITTTEIIIISIVMDTAFQK